MEKLTDAAKANKTYTVGHDQTTGEVTITEVEGQKNFDLTTMSGIEKSLGFKKAVTNPVDISKGLTLQIGDTADSFNQLKVNIMDCHAAAMGVADISVANQEDAAEAMRWPRPTRCPRACCSCSVNQTLFLERTA